MSCPVCSESFQDNESTDIIPRRLICGHILCGRCILDNFFDDTFYCPECFVELKGSNIDDFSVLATEEDFNATIDEDTVPNHEDTLLNTSLTTARSPRVNCSVEGCQNKAMSMNGLCLQHSKKRHKSMACADIIAKSISNTSFHSLISNSGNIVASNRSINHEPLAPHELREQFDVQKRIELGEAMELIDVAKAILIREPNVLNITAPVVTVGDIHGQYYDLVNLLKEGGSPGDDEQYLFLGDYVDRGNFSCEVMFMLISLKIKFPTKIWLLRGNHECASVSGHFGFKEECKMKYGMNVYYNFLLLFQTLPLAAVIKTEYGDIFACHGGLSPSLLSIDDINRMNRLVEPEAESGLLDIVWADPINDDDTDNLTDEEYEAYMSIQWRTNPTRGCSYAFGYKALRDFLDSNNLVCIVRAHEVQEQGFKRHFEPENMERRIKMLVRNRLNTNSSSKGSAPECGIQLGKKREFPPLITIFSAPNYCDRYQNRGAILRIESGLDGFKVLQYDCVPHPVPEMAESQTDNFISAITGACPYMPTSFRSFVRRAVELGYEEEQNLVVDPGTEDAKSKGATTPSNNNNSNNINNHDNESASLEVKTPSDIQSDPNVAVAVEVQTPGARREDCCETPRHSEFDANNNADIIRHLRTFPVRRGSVNKTTGGDGLFSPAMDGSAPPQEGSEETGGMGSARGMRRRSSVTISMVRTPQQNECSWNDSVDCDDSTQQQSQLFNNNASTDELDEFGLPRNEHLQEPASLQTSQDSDNDAGIVHPSGAPPRVGQAAATSSAPSSSSGSSVSVRLFTSVEDQDLHVPPVNVNTPHPSTGPAKAPQESPRHPLTSFTPSGLNTTTPRKQVNFFQSSTPNSSVVSTPGQVQPSGAPLQQGIRRRGSQYGIQTGSGAYLEAHASDSINEVHPEMLKSTSASSLVQENFSKFKELTRQAVANLTANVNVQDIKKKFESGAASSSSSHAGMQRTISNFSADVASLAKLYGGSGPVRKFGRSPRASPRSTPPSAPPPASGLHFANPPQPPSVESSPKASVSRLADINKRECEVRLQTLSKGEIGVGGSDAAHPSHRDHGNTEADEAAVDADSHMEEEAGVGDDGGTTYEDDDKIVFNPQEILALKLMFSLFDRSGSSFISYEDLVAYGEETGGDMEFRYATIALEIVDIDGDGKIGLLDFIHFAARLKAAHEEIESPLK